MLTFALKIHGDERTFSRDPLFSSLRNVNRQLMGRNRAKRNESLAKRKTERRRFIRVQCSGVRHSGSRVRHEAVDIISRVFLQTLVAGHPFTSNSSSDARAFAWIGVGWRGLAWERRFGYTQRGSLGLSRHPGPSAPIPHFATSLSRSELRDAVSQLNRPAGCASCGSLRPAVGGPLSLSRDEMAGSAYAGWTGLQCASAFNGCQFPNSDLQPSFGNEDACFLLLGSRRRGCSGYFDPKFQQPLLFSHGGTLMDGESSSREQCVLFAVFSHLGRLWVFSSALVRSSLHNAAEFTTPSACSSGGTTVDPQRRVHNTEPVCLFLRRIFRHPFAQAVSRLEAPLFSFSCRQAAALLF
ncbi:hypothetical protein C8R43DRAFT_589125 [Mycena crocata]|nr:hypothetical protein C8R43DRAFT_589125 [Mycena crocata]